MSWYFTACVTTACEGNGRPVATNQVAGEPLPHTQGHRICYCCPRTKGKAQEGKPWPKFWYPTSPSSSYYDEGGYGSLRLLIDSSSNYLTKLSFFHNCLLITTALVLVVPRLSK